MQMTAGSGLSFRKAAKARHAEEAIGHSEGLVTVLRLTQADLRPAEDAIRIAKELFSAAQYSKALDAAHRAETIAITLDERHSGYQKVKKSLDATLGELRRLGLPAEAFEAVSGRGDEVVLSGIWENGAFVPNYLEARVLVEKATQEARAALLKANEASNAVFLAELAIEALAEVKGPADPKTFADGATVGLDQALEEATRELALGHLEEGIKVARDLEARATRLRAAYVEASRLLTDTEAKLTDLRGEGISTERLERQLELSKDVLSRGMVESGITVAKRISKETDGLAELFRRATTRLADAEVLYAQLNREGFHSYDAESAMRDARKSIREGNYARAIEHVQRANAAFVRRQNVREALARAIEETRGRVTMLRNSGLPFIPDVQELLGRAEREFRDGNYSGSSEDLRIATLLLGGRNGGTNP
ncbi:MAG TPA: hypothetical protein VJ326_04615 [Thermoplasmata archaeon]|nr:hypothetical protein [Thermoplasmata archaeon]